MLAFLADTIRHITGLTWAQLLTHGACLETVVLLLAPLPINSASSASDAEMGKTTVVAAFETNLMDPSA